MSPKHTSSAPRRGRRLLPVLTAALVVSAGAAAVGLSDTAATFVGLAAAAHTDHSPRGEDRADRREDRVSGFRATASSARQHSTGSASGRRLSPAPSPTGPTPSGSSTTRSTSARPAPTPITPDTGNGALSASASTATRLPADCPGARPAVIRPSAGTYSTQWEAASPPDDAVYDLSGVRSTAYPTSHSPFAVGTGTPALRTCVVGGTIQGRADADLTWSLLHDQYNAACLRIIAREWMQVSRLRCDNVEDGIRPLESGVNANNTQIRVSGTYLSHIRDDCMENDYTVGGVVSDSLWESCNTGVSERPSGGRSWSTPPSETLTLDHMLIGLYQTPHVESGRTVMGENGLFKWSSSGNHLVIKCSTFKVDSLSLNGRDAMSLPSGTVVDDSECPGHPSTIVWLGGGAYPGSVPGIRVVSDPAVWNGAVGAWKAAHGL